METTVDIDDFAGGIGQISARYGRNSAANV